ncbi:hypothetical protein NDU88_005839 [Pleurodeles waltl]|uniref:Uncharacterized protein n=1 Tax=Pleurodeles waltl TaxID=8319 RepID=A0AAV7WC66_PLEWA|nr:hypothetical protein NDU88_005839 [Pleurodeles waltl]
MGRVMGNRRALEGDYMQLDDQLHPLDNEQGRCPEALRWLLEVREEYAVSLEKLRCHDHVGCMRRVHEEEGRAGGLLAWIAPTQRGPRLLGLHCLMIP